MTRRSGRRPPLPQRDGLDAVWVRTPARVGAEPAPWRSLRDFLCDRLPQHVPVDAWLAGGRFVDDAGRPFEATAPYVPATFVWFHRDPPAPEASTGPLTVLHRDDRILVVDKPSFLATIPRGSHVTETVLVRCRRELGLPELSPAHRLDRLTAGVLLLTIHARDRSAYQGLFERREAAKTYEALAPAPSGSPGDDTLPLTRRSHITKRRGSLQAVEVPDAAPNAETRISLLEQRDGIGRYLLEPRTGRTHQLRLHMAALGWPILGDPLYPAVSDAPEDPARPLCLVARRLAFRDPGDGHERVFTSRIPLPWPS